MSTENNLVIKAGEGSCLTTLGYLLLIPVPFSAWVIITNLIADQTSIVRRALFQSEGLILFSILLGFVLHEFCQYFAHRWFGESPRYRNRKHIENRTYLERKYLFPIAIRFWSPNKKFSVAQYLAIVLLPTLVNFLFLPLIMVIWQDPSIVSAIWVIGYTNSFIIPLDLLVVGKIVSSVKDGLYVVDKADGTYLVRK